MDMRRVQHEVLVEEWKQLITTCRTSGMSVSRWCRENEIKEGRYYYWLKVIRNEALVKHPNTSGTGMAVFALFLAE